jgi:signal transduction histidine kinase
VAQNAQKHGEDPAFRAEAMKTVTRTAEQMGELMAQLSRRSPGHGRVAAVDLPTLVSETVGSLGPEFGAELLPVSGAPGQVLAVPEQLQQVLLNLLLNAKKAAAASAPATGTGPLVSVRVVGGVGQVRLEVEDRGPGIPPERMRTLFQPFQSGAAGSFGIGLYESKRIVESYRGTLRVESEAGRGTRVSVELPAVASDAVERPAAPSLGVESGSD